MTSKERIGILFTVISLSIFVLHLWGIFSGTNESILKWDHALYISLGVLSIISIYACSIISKSIQIGIPLIMGVVSIASSRSEVYTGLILIIIAILVAFHFKIYSKDIIIRITISIIVLYAMFAFVPQWTGNEKYLIPIAWVLLVCGFLFLLWIIFKDSIDELEKREQEKLKRCIDVADEALSVAKDAVNKLEKR